MKTNETCQMNLSTETCQSHAVLSLRHMFYARANYFCFHMEYWRCIYVHVLGLHTNFNRLKIDAKSIVLAIVTVIACQKVATWVLSQLTYFQWVLSEREERNKTQWQTKKKKREIFDHYNGKNSIPNGAAQS